MSNLLHALSIRWRLALLSAGLTFLVLCAFAVVIGQLTASRIRSDFRNEMSVATTNVGDRLRIYYQGGEGHIDEGLVQSYAAPNSAVIRVVYPTGRVLAHTPHSPDFEQMGLKIGRTGEVGGYRVVQRFVYLTARVAGSVIRQPVYLQYARKTAPTEASIHRVRLFLLFGVLGGAGLALGLALAVSRRALAPITRLTSTAREIAATRDPNRRVPVPDTEDEVAELARTLDEMLLALEASREEREALLVRQRQFVADASHELRTPLTSVLANLELLADVLDGERGEAARSALRSTQRMRRLVGDLLLLARADAQREVPHAPTDLAGVVIDAAAELGPMTEDHELSVDASPVTVDGARDELHRLVLNLMQNAAQHTPPGTHIRAQVRRVGDTAQLVVSDDGPGVPDELRDRVFDRFVRGEGDRGGSVGLGLSIVRAVARTHGGDVELQSPPEGGSRFVVTLPAMDAEPEPAAEPVAPVLTAESGR
jgi:two-component system, OmpR family, sensor kinase